MRTRYLLLLSVLIACSPADGGGGTGAEEQDAALATIVVVRHAEKGAGEDPGLTHVGRERATRLRDRLAEAQVTAVYSTATRRTQATAQPTADHHGLPVELYEPNDPQMIQALRATAIGNTVLVVGHSNTVPELVSKLVPRTTVPLIEEDDFGNLYCITLREGRQPRLRQLRY